MSAPSLEDVRAHLATDYAGVFAPGQVEAHVEDYVALEAAWPLVDQVRARLPGGARVLDVGCGYGSFVTEARAVGLDARGVDTAEFEIEFARGRLAERQPGSPDDAFVIGDGQRLPFETSSFDAVTMWNVIEHVPDTASLLAEIDRVLVGGGWLFAIAPNYAAFRREAHYHVPWVPLMPRPIASRYLRAKGRDPRFFETSIFYCTNRGIRRALRARGFDVVDRRAERLAEPAEIENPKVRRAVSALDTIGLGGLAPALARVLAANPVVATISIEAHKRADAAPGGRTP